MELFDPPLSSWKSVSFNNYQFLQAGQMWYHFHQTTAVSPCPHTGQISSVFCSTSSGKGELFPSFIGLPVLSSGGANCPPTGLDSEVTSRAEVVLCSPGGIADSLGWNLVSSRTTQVGRSLRFCVCELWQVQDITDTCSSLCCIFDLPIEEKCS